MPPTRRNGFVDARGRAALNAHQTTAIVVWTCEALGFYLLLAPSIADARATRRDRRVRVRVRVRDVRVRARDGDRPGRARAERRGAVLRALRRERRATREALPGLR